MGKKLTNLNRYISVITDIDENWFVTFEHAIKHLSFSYVRLPLPEHNFSFLFSYFFFLFSYSSWAIYLS